MDLTELSEAHLGKNLLFGECYRPLVAQDNEPDEMNYLLNWSYLTAGDGRNKVRGVTSGGIHHRTMMTPKLHAEKKLDGNLQSS